MGVNRKLMRYYACALLATMSLAVSLQAKTNPSARIANIQIDNFGRINDNYYRGAQPDGGDYADLAALGVKTVIDLTENGRADEAGIVQHAGMKFYRIPMTTSDQPADAAVSQFLKLVNDPAN